jgi:hypothetical protein
MERFSWLVTAEGDLVYDNAFPVGVEHTGSLNMAVEAGMLLKTGCKCFGKFGEWFGR